MTDQQIVPIARYEVEVGEQDIDQLGHVNNRVYLAWCEQAAIYASGLNGWPQERYMHLGKAWVARQHWIEYLRPCFAGDRIEIWTWVHKTQGNHSLRRYTMLRGGRVVCTAATEWVFVDLASGRAVECPDEVRAHFVEVPADDSRLRERMIARQVRFAPTQDLI